MNYERQLIELIKRNNGLVFSSQVDEAGIPRIYLSQMVHKGMLYKFSRGAYLTSDAADDEMVRLQARYPKGVFSHGTALYLHGLQDRAPLYYTMTFPDKYHCISLEDGYISAFYVNKQNFELGMTNQPSMAGRLVRTYNRERTICDIVRNRNKTDNIVLYDALKRYVGSKSKDIQLLMEYAKSLRVEKKMREYIEGLL